ncbi:replication protein [Legionella sp.]|uniref:replication protein n=1 Tax=Legionella sp. TaxID=459 RepID=UPI003C8CBB22
MAVLRIHKKQRNFVILDKTCLYDESLSWGAKGLHAYLMSLPDDWKVRVSDLKERARNGRDAVRGLLSELEQAGYIQKSTCRDDVSGRFGGVEYLVLEIPEFKNQENNPETEKSSLVKNEQKTPSPENPSLVSPETGNSFPVKPTLINNNRINNKELSIKTAANSELTELAAAAFSSEDKATTHETFFSTRIPHDSVIGESLTLNQISRIRTLAKNLNINQVAEDEEQWFSEIQHCVLNPKNFTACGRDFSRKLSAIRTVIWRGEWQTPASMVLEKQDKTASCMKELERELRETQAEAVHFQKLLVTAKEHTKSYFEEIIKNARIKISNLEYKMANFSVFPESESRNIEFVTSK